MASPVSVTVPLPNLYRGQFTFLGLSLPSQGQAAMRWSYQPPAPNQDLTNLEVPGLPEDAPFGWYTQSISPITWQGNYNFGIGLALQIQINRPMSTYQASANYTTGRVVVHIPNTAQVIVSAPKVSASDVNNLQPFDTESFLIPVVINSNSTFRLCVEADSTGQTTPPLPASTTVVLATLFNFTLPPFWSR
jgi:hypothetical protein